MLIPWSALCAAAAHFGFKRLIHSFLDSRMNMFWRPSSIMVRTLNGSRTPFISNCTF